ncbi:MAG: DNA-binding protein [Promethearchaeota archaeon]
MSDEEMEEIRRRKLAELQRAAIEEQQAAAAQEELQRQREAVLRQILTPEARARLVNLRMVKPAFAEQLENELIRLAQMKRLPSIPLSDRQLKQMLAQVRARQRETKIQFKH